MPERPKVCIIGCGPCGMSALYHFAKLPDEEMPDVVCYEKQNTWGGQWNPTWKTGTDEYGELVHSTIYPNLVTNVPKEVMEYPDYTFKHHFGRALPSYVDAACIREYLDARMKNGGKRDLNQYISFSTVVRNVDYNKDEQRFSITVHNLTEDRTYEENGFTHIIVATGIFSVPRFPIIPGAEKFKGRILHSRDLREASEFSGKNILILGSSYSAQDTALLTLKYGAKRVICSWRSGPMGYKWPSGIEERPQVKSFDEHSVQFSDGSMANVDVIIFCTGYQKHYPFLPDDLRLKEELSFYPDNLYKGVLYMKDGSKRVLYLGVQNQAFSFPMFDVQGLWACRYITGTIHLPEKGAMLQNIELWKKKYQLVKDAPSAVDFQTEYVTDVSNAVGYSNKFKETNALFQEWIRNKKENIGTFKERCFASVYSGIMAEPRR